MESHDHHHRKQTDYLAMGDMDALAMKVRAPFTLQMIHDLPVGAHVIFIHVDAETGKAIALEGMIWTESVRADALIDHEDEDLEQRYSGTLIWVPPAIVAAYDAREQSE